MKQPPLNIVMLGLSITSSWGNGHATTFRGLVRELAKNGHHITFLERDQPWYAANRDLPIPSFCKVILYQGVDELGEQHASLIREANLVIVGSYVPDGVAVGELVTATAKGITAFYDIDTPVTLAKIKNGDFEYLHPALIPRYNLYLSFTGGPTLRKLEDQYGSPMAMPFYCSFDPELYYPQKQKIKWDLGYLGTYSDDRQPSVQKLVLDAARILPKAKFVIAGPQYPNDIDWPGNIERIEHLAPAQHRDFYNRQRFTMNITRLNMIEAGFSPSVRLFEAAACGIPIISDYWEGIDHFFEINREILISVSAADTAFYIKSINEEERKAIGERARQKVLQYHTAAHRAIELEMYYKEVITRKSSHQLFVKQ